VRLQSALTDLNTLVSQALETLNGALQSSVATGLAPVPEISVDREQMQKVLVNLILNAQEACGGGEIRISTGIDENRAMIAVRDNGCGMSGDFMERSLFLPFQTTKKRGLGIGLFHCKQIVDAHGGQIEVESVEGKGSTFRVMLPIGESQRAVSKRERHSDQRRGRRSEKYGRTQTYPSLKRPVWTGIKMKGL
jgi:signal transduction histidine kinase